jgi:hypothetical protein
MRQVKCKTLDGVKELAVCKKELHCVKASRDGHPGYSIAAG